MGRWPWNFVTLDERRDWQQEADKKRERRVNLSGSGVVRGLTRGKLTKFVNCVCCIVATPITVNRACQSPVCENVASSTSGSLRTIASVIRNNGAALYSRTSNASRETMRPLLREKVSVLAENSGIGRLPREINSRQSRRTQLSAWSTRPLVSQLIGLAVAIESFRAATTGEHKSFSWPRINDFECSRYCLRRFDIIVNRESAYETNKKSYKIIR